MDDLGRGASSARPRARCWRRSVKVERRALPVLDAVLGWVAAEARRFRPGAPEPPMLLRVRAVDAALIALTLAPGAVLFA